MKRNFKILAYRNIHGTIINNIKELKDSAFFLRNSPHWRINEVERLSDERKFKVGTFISLTNIQGMTEIKEINENIKGKAFLTMGNSDNINLIIGIDTIDVKHTGIDFFKNKIKEFRHSLLPKPGEDPIDKLEAKLGIFSPDRMVITESFESPVIRAIKAVEEEIIEQEKPASRQLESDYVIDIRDQLFLREGHPNGLYQIVIERNKYKLKNLRHQTFYKGWAVTPKSGNLHQFRIGDFKNLLLKGPTKGSDFKMIHVQDVYNNCFDL